jgi:hypothetical protein
LVAFAAFFCGLSEARPSEAPVPVSTSLPLAIPHLGEPHLDSQLVEVARAERSGGRGAGLSSARAQSVGVAQGRVRVVVEADAGRDEASRAAVVAAGGVVIAESGDLVEALVPPGSLRSLAASDGVAFVRAPARPFPDAVDEGVAATGADVWHAAGYNGDGVKVGIIDLGFYGYQSLLGTALPATVTTHDTDCGSGFDGAPPDGSEHGTAVAELVHQMAPAAQLYLICVASDVGLAQAEQYAVANGIRIVNHSVSWFAISRGDGTGAAGTPDAVVADARSHGILWVNAAGNYATRHWSGTFSPDAADPRLADFAPGDPLNRVTISGGEQVCAFLTWDDWNLTSEDYDLALVQVDGTVVASSTDDQSGGPGQPSEGLCYTNPSANGITLALVIERYSVVGSPRLDLFYTGSGSLWYANAAGSVPVPGSSPDAFAVGADCWLTGALEPYSSQGPTITGLTKPDLVAPDSVSTVTYGYAGLCGAGFAGTSASAPQVAGAAAMVLGRDPTLTAAGLEGALERSSLGADGTMSTPSNTLGHGRLKLGATDPLAGTIAFASIYGGIYTVTPDGAGVVHVPMSGGPLTFSAPAWAPDGGKIAFGSNSGIWTVPAAGGTPTQILAFGAQPSWSPDGTKIAYGDGDIGVAKADGSNPTSIVTGGGNVAPSWSPDGTKIAYIAQTGNSYDVWVANANGSNKTQLTSFGDVNSGYYDQHAVSWSPDGTKLAFVRGLNLSNQVWVMNTDGTNAHAIGPPAGAINFASPVWSPDGGTILFSDTFGGGTGGGLWEMTAAGTGAHEVMPTPNGYPVDGPSWLAAPLTAPTSLGAPSLGGLNGGAVVGETLEAGSGEWAPSAGDKLSYSWSRCNAAGSACVTVAGANDSTYLVSGSDLGKRLRATVTATNAAGSTSADSAPSEVVQIAAAVPSALPTISGTAVPGHTLMLASDGTWSDTPSFTQQWRRCDDAGGGCTDIPGATSTAYTATTADAGNTIRLAVTATNAGGQTYASSEAASAVPGAPTDVVASPADGQATVDFTEPPDGGSPITSYTVTASPGGATATGAGTELTVTGLTNGTSYTFTVAATNALGAGPASAASNAVTPQQPGINVSISPATQTVTQGQSAVYSISITAVGGFTGQLTITATGPPGATGTFSTNAPLTLTVTPSTTTPAGTYQVSVRAASADGTIVGTASASLTVNAAGGGGGGGGAGGGGGGGGGGGAPPVAPPVAAPPVAPPSVPAAKPPSPMRTTVAVGSPLTSVTRPAAISLKAKKPTLTVTLVLARAAGLQLVLRDAKGHLLASWSRSAKAGTAKLKLVLPKKARKPGRDNLEITVARHAKTVPVTVTV